MDYYRKLYNIKPGDASVPVEPSKVLARIQTALKMGFPWEMITTIPNHDLNALIIETAIQNRLNELSQREKNRLNEKGIERHEATAEDFDSFFR
ncbi:hypothetical protein [Paracholeplasma manati]|uniref:hypothetical protein n=1 Tax=Paracholeplasma manati TaxID=591373 RepID=UPI0024077B6E|nr:hypothetical protein [Paracholeplasma manati]